MVKLFNIIFRKEEKKSEYLAKNKHLNKKFFENSVKDHTVQKAKRLKS